MRTPTALLLVFVVALTLAPRLSGAESVPGAVRVMTYNIQDLRPEQIMDPDDERVGHCIALIRASGARVVLINEMAWTQDGRHAAHFAERLGEDTGYSWAWFAAPSNTGEHSGLDLDNNGSSSPEDDARVYGGDCFGYGEFPGHYAMALFVRSDVTVLWDDVRTFRTLLWKDMPGAMLPPADGNGEGSWYSDEELDVFRLGSKSHWDVPVRLSDGRVVHLLCAHPTPPVFDGPEDRNGRRNHDEIRLWLDYLDGADWIVDDAGRRGGLDEDAHFIVMGDLNADPDEGDARENPAKKLLDHPRVNGAMTPASSVPGETRRREALDPDDTSGFGLRIDYVQPSLGLPIGGCGVLRGSADLPDSGLDAAVFGASDHFPVWLDVRLTTSP